MEARPVICPECTAIFVVPADPHRPVCLGCWKPLPPGWALLYHGKECIAAMLDHREQAAQRRATG